MKIKVGVIFGGESVEHEVSIISASQAMNSLDSSKYEVVPIYITKDREWYTHKLMRDVAFFKDLNKLKEKSHRVVLSYDHEQKVSLRKVGKKAKLVKEIDVIFPVVHGTNGEDGSLQGYLEMIGVPYVGCRVYGAVAGQDKIFMKQILNQEDVQVTDYAWFYSTDYINDPDKVLEHVQKIKGPWIVKPASLGSSVGISKADDLDELVESIEEAMTYDIKVIVESVVSNLVEVNCSVYGDFEEQHASVVEEVMGNDEFLSFKDKYLGSSDKTGSSKGMASTNRIIPARISYELEQTVKNMAKKAFKVLNASGVSRIDFLIDKETEEVYVNEINTIPGSLSFYLWEPVGISFDKLSDELIRLALKRSRINDRLTFSYDSNILENYEKGSKGAKSKVG